MPAALPLTSAFVDPGVTEAGFRTALTELRNYHSGVTGEAGTPTDARQTLGTLFNGIQVKTAAYTVTTSDAGDLIDCTGTFTLALPAVATAGAGFTVAVRNNDTGNITIDPNSSQLVNGAATYSLKTLETVILVCDGTAWTALSIVNPAQTTTTDTTSGRLLRVGAFGWGNDGAGVTNVADLDALQVSGIWSYSGGVGAPSFSGIGLVIHLNRLTSANASYSATQIALSPAGGLSMRTRTNSVWSEWTQALFSTAIGSTVQAYDAELNAIAGLTSAADRLPYFTGSGTAATATFTAAGRALVDDVDAAAQRATLGVVIGTHVQAYDPELQAIAGLVSAADRLPYFTGSGTAGLATFTAAGRALVDDADAAAQRTTLGLGTGATATVQTSGTDETAGRLMTVGAFGIGASGAAYNSDIDALTVNGFYSVTSTTISNSPNMWSGALLGSSLIHLRYSTTAARQIITNYASTGARLAMRNQVAGVWGAWSEFITKTNLVGTVSQSAGVPTGAVIEKGTNANGRYVRWADGTQICQGIVVGSATAGATWTFPAAFSTIDNAEFSVVGTATIGTNARMVTTDAAATTSVDVHVWDAGGARTTNSARIIAIGRWF